jgi:hypothetical protein
MNVLYNIFLHRNFSTEQKAVCQLKRTLRELTILTPPTPLISVCTLELLSVISTQVSSSPPKLTSETSELTEYSLKMTALNGFPDRNSSRVQPTAGANSTRRDNFHAEFSITGTTTRNSIRNSSQSFPSHKTFGSDTYLHSDLTVFGG